jgi:hypothetical protein
MTKILNEGLKYMDMENQVVPFVGVDQFKSSVGDDAGLITLNFIVKSKAVGEDLAEWFEKGYPSVIDAEVSPGEVIPGKYYVYVEVERKITSPSILIEMLEDLETLTGFTLKEWKMKIGNETKPASKEFIKQNLSLTSREYNKETDKEHEESLNEWREIAGIKTVSSYEDDEYLKSIKRQAGIF